jgi:hypothetical protein
MHQMRISTTYAQCWKKLKSKNKNVKNERADKNHSEIHEIEPNSSKDRAMNDL